MLLNDDHECVGYLVVPPDLADKVGKSLIDIDPLLGRSLNELAIKMLRKITTL